MQTLTKKITYDEYRRFEADDFFYYELINGELVQKNSPSPQHQMILANLFRKMDGFVYERKLGKVLFAPVDVFVDDHSAPQPDLLFIPNAKLGIITKDGIFGAPEIVVEIISPSSVVRDRVDKSKLYHQLGVPEYWLIDPKNRTAEVYQRTGSGYDVFSFVAETGAVRSQVLPDFLLTLEELFA